MTAPDRVFDGNTDIVPMLAAAGTSRVRYGCEARAQGTWACHG